MTGASQLLAAVVFLPLVGAFLLMLFPADDHRNLKATAFGLSALNFVLSAGLWMSFEPRVPGYQFETNLAWIEQFGIRFHLGIDGISLLLVLLTTFLVPITLLGAWTAIEARVKEFTIAILALETGMLGAFVSLDLFLFYVFWEAMLVPMYFLIGIWGGQRRIYAAIKFFIFTMAGSLLMLVAILYVASQPDGGWDFSLYAALARSFEPTVEPYLFWAFAVAFAIKVPLFPVHTWLPDAHVEAPTAGSVILAGVLLKLGVYGFIRFAFPMFPTAAFAALPLITVLSLISIVYGALAAWVQPDMKKLVAYSSISHLGFCMLGLAAMSVEAVTGSVFIMLAHGVSTGALFLLVGVLYERRHTRVLADYGGIAKRAPIFAFFLVFMVMASAGLPALSGFPGEFLVLLGTFTSKRPMMMAAACIAATGVILAAVYLLWMVHRILFGPLQNPENQHIKDMNLREIAVLAPLAVLAIVLGVAPGLVTDRVEPAVEAWVQQLHERADGIPAYQPDHGALAPVSLTRSVGPRLRRAPVQPVRPAQNDAQRRLDRLFRRGDAQGVPGGPGQAPVARPGVEAQGARPVDRSALRRPILIPGAPAPAPAPRSPAGGEVN
ncbi:MAG: NADH-quinone oxidoreductase subunit M [Deltaproteobacteria bacterium]|nr:NADH-quinone oxidoreductase subunit M [Deltaproteobacteria bacterium]